MAQMHEQTPRGTTGRTTEPTLQDRLENVEVRLAYLEKSLGDLDDAVRQMANKMDLVARVVQGIEGRLETSPGGPAEISDGQ